MHMRGRGNIINRPPTRHTWRSALIIAIMLSVGWGGCLLRPLDRCAIMFTFRMTLCVSVVWMSHFLCVSLSLSSCVCVVSMCECPTEINNITLIKENECVCVLLARRGSVSRCRAVFHAICFMLNNNMYDYTTISGGSVWLALNVLHHKIHIGHGIRCDGTNRWPISSAYRSAPVDVVVVVDVSAMSNVFVLREWAIVVVERDMIILYMSFCGHPTQSNPNENVVWLENTMFSSVYCCLGHFLTKMTFAHHHPLFCLYEWCVVVNVFACFFYSIFIHLAECGLSFYCIYITYDKTVSTQRQSNYAYWIQQQQHQRNGDGWHALISSGYLMKTNGTVMANIHFVRKWKLQNERREKITWNYGHIIKQ